MAAKSEGTPNTIAEIEGIAERGAAWVGENLILVGVLVAVLLGCAFLVESFSRTDVWDGCNTFL